MLDFRSALYLGLGHAHADLRPWSRITTGAPAALIPPPGARWVGSRVARLAGTESGVLGPSTLHLFWDLFHLLVTEDAFIVLDSRTYPIARWGVERVRARGIPVRVFRHHQPDDLDRVVRRTNRRPIVVSDGLCPECGALAPLAAYTAVTRRHGGLIVVDDTQALGIFGAGRDRARPWGTGGGGALRAAGVAGRDLIVVSSLAKGFGAPLAVLLGARVLVRGFAARSETRVHSSAPSAASIAAAARALQFNATEGDVARAGLIGRIRILRRTLARGAVALSGGLFPVQTLHDVRGTDAITLHDRLARRGINGVLRGGSRRRARLTFLLTAAHSPDDVREAGEAILEELDDDPRLLAGRVRTGGGSIHVDDA